MDILSPRPLSPEEHELEALIREARERQRRRWLVAATVAAASAAAVVGVQAISGGHSPGARQRPGRRPLALTPRCKPGQLRVSERGGGAYTGHSVIGLALENVSTAPCTLRGRPRVQLVMRGSRLRPGDVYRLRNVRPGSDAAVPVRTVVLAPGGAASFNVVVLDQWGRNGPMSSRFCAWSRALLITPPGSRGSVRAGASLSDCGLGVTPMVAGKLDRYSFQ